MLFVFILIISILCLLFKEDIDSYEINLTV